MIALDTLKAWLGVTGTADDALLTDIEQRAVALFQDESGRYFEAVASATEFLPGTGRRRLWLQEPPTNTPTVTEHCTAGDTGTVIVAANDDGFVVRADGQLVRKGSCVWRRCYEYEVTYQRGYVAGQEPGLVRQAVIAICEALYRENKRGSSGLKSETVVNYSYTVADPAGVDLCDIPVVREALEVWHRPVVT